MTGFRRNAVIGVASGSIQITQRVWLERTALTHQTTVQRGGVFQVPCSGWPAIRADSDAEIDLPWVAGFWSGVLDRLVAPWKAGAWVAVKRLAEPGIPAV